MANELIKIENDLDLAQAVMRAIYFKGKKQSVLTADVISHIMGKYETDAVAIESMINILYEKYGVLGRQTTTTSSPKGDLISTEIRWSFSFD